MLHELLKNKFIWLLLGLALFVGILYVTPELLIWNKLNQLGKPFVLIQMTHHGDEAYGTISRFREIYDGHFPPGDLYMDTSAPTPFGPFQIMPLLMAAIIYLFGGNINLSYLFATFIFPPVIFLLFYWLGKVITGNKAFSVFIALIGTLTPLFRALPAAFQSVELFLNNAVKYFIPLISTPLAKLPLGRTEDQLLTYLAFLPALAALLLFWKKPSRKSGALAGALIGLMFYIYFHYWVFLVIVAGLIGVFSLLTAGKNLNLFQSVLAMFSALAAVTVPYWINFWAFRQSPTAAEVTGRIGVEVSRAPFFIAGEPAVFHYIFYALLAVFVYFVFFKRNLKNEAVLYWIFIGAMYVVWNVQVITGYVPSPDHWMRPISACIFIILSHGAYELLKKVNYRTVTICLMIGSALLISKKIVNAFVFINPPKEFVADNTFESRAFNPGIVDSWSWINANLPHEPKIISPSFITSLYLIAQTSARPYFAGGFNTSAPNSVLEEHFLKTYKLFSVPPAFLKNVLEMDYQKMVCTGECINQDMHTNQNIIQTISYLYVGYYVNEPGRPKSDGQYRFISKEKADELIATYPKVRARWKDIGADYVYYGPWEKEITVIDLSKDPGLELVHKNQDVEIYKIKK